MSGSVRRQMIVTGVKAEIEVVAFGGDRRVAQVEVVAETSMMNRETMRVVFDAAPGEFQVGDLIDVVVTNLRGES